MLGDEAPSDQDGADPAVRDLARVGGGHAFSIGREAKVIKGSWMGGLTVVLGDLTEQSVDAIVNAANSSLLGGGGVDGSIHRAGGPEIGRACRQLGGCETGDAKATTAGRLPARWVVHAVGPVWRGGQAGEHDLLASAHRRSLEVALELGARTVAFPAISCGIYGFPADQAAPVAIAAAREFLDRVDEIRFVLFDETLRRVFADAADAAGA